MKTILLIIAIAGILFFAYRKVADYHFIKGLKAAEEKYMKMLSESKESFIGTNALPGQKSGMENTVVGSKNIYTIEQVLNKKVRFANGSVGIIIGGQENALLTEWENGNVSGFASIKDIIEIIK